MFLGALLIGAVVGVLSGLFGVGGGFLITPLLNIALGVPMPIAVGTGALQILGVSTAGLYRRHKEGLTDYKLATVLLGGNYVGVRLGAQTIASLKTAGSMQLAGNSVPAADFYILCAFLLVLTGIAGWLIYDTTHNKVAPAVRVGLFARVRIPPYTSFRSLERPRLSIVVISYFGLILGFLTGLLGIGGGVILLPALVYLIGMRTYRATATSLAIVWVSSLIATITHSLAGNTDLSLAIPLLLGGTVGLQFGSRLCSRLGGPRLRRYFSLVVLAAIALVAAKIAALAL